MRPVAVYIIYSADILGSPREFDSLDPTKSNGNVPVFPNLVETEGDDQYDFGYLGNESGDVSYFPHGAIDAEGTEPPEDFEGETGDGLHRKWAGELTPEEWEAFADRFLIDLDENLVPLKYEETMGSITEHGLIPAVAVDNTEGWAPTRVIDSMIYVSFAGEHQNGEDGA